MKLVLSSLIGFLAMLTEQGKVQHGVLSVQDITIKVPSNPPMAARMPPPGNISVAPEPDIPPPMIGAPEPSERTVQALKTRESLLEMIKRADTKQNLKSPAAGTLKDVSSTTGPGASLSGDDLTSDLALKLKNMRIAITESEEE